jgi:hypothetical protein
MDKSIRAAWAASLKVPLNFILNSIEDGDDVEVRERVIEYLARSLRNLPVAQRKIEGTPIHRFAHIIKHNDSMNYKNLCNKVRPFVKSPHSFLKSISQFAWKTDIKLPIDVRKDKQCKDPKYVKQKPIGTVKQINDALFLNEEHKSFQNSLATIESYVKANLEKFDKIYERLSRLESDFLNIFNVADSKSTTAEDFIISLSKIFVTHKFMINANTTVGEIQNLQAMVEKLKHHSHVGNDIVVLTKL